MPKHVLVATDFSKRSAIACERARDLAGLTGAAITYLHVIDEDQPQSLIDAARREAEILLSPGGPAARPDVKVSHCILVGDPHEAINDAAEETGADLLVFGAHRRAPLRNAFIGTTAERAIRRSRIPALVVRLRNEAEPSCVERQGALCTARSGGTLELPQRPIPQPSRTAR